MDDRPIGSITQSRGHAFNNSLSHDSSRRLFMKNYRNFKLISMVLAIFLFFSIAVPALAGDVTLIGEVNENYQLVSNGQIYEIADTPKGNEMAENFISSKVKVTGTVEEKNEMKTITVINFEVVAE
jgi:hypothetical protein